MHGAHGNYSWPGNVRQLSNLAGRAALVADDHVELNRPATTAPPPSSPSSLY